MTETKMKCGDFRGLLEGVSYGLADKEILEQSIHFVFKDDRVNSFNDEVSCSAPLLLGGIEGVVKGRFLLSVLGKLAEGIELTIKELNGSLRIQWKGHRASINMEQKILLPIDAVEEPTKWKKLPKDFLNAVKAVYRCASKDESDFCKVCVHIHPNYVEACDGYQLARWSIKTGFKEEYLVRSSTIGKMLGLGMIEYSLSDEWIHFRNGDDLRFSCRRWLVQYHNLDKHFQVKGVTIPLPKGLADLVQKAEQFSEDGSLDETVKITVKDGKMLVRGKGLDGWLEGYRKVDYKGDPMIFLIAPSVLVDLSKQTEECVVTKGRLKMEASSFEFVSCLGAEEEEKD